MARCGITNRNMKIKNFCVNAAKKRCTQILCIAVLDRINHHEEGWEREVRAMVGADGEGLKLSGFRASLTTVWPSIGYLSLGILLAWVYLVVDFGAWMTQTDAANVSVIDSAWHVYIASAVVLLLAALAQRQFSRLFSLRFVGIAVAVIPTLGIFMLIIGGPKFLNVPMLSPILFQLGTILVGIGCGLMFLRVAQLYCTLDPSKVFLYAAFSELIVAIVFYFVLGNSWIVLVEGAPPFINLFAVMALPSLIVALTSLKGAGQAEAPQSDSLTVHRFLRAYPSLGKLLVAVFIFTATASIVRNYFMLDQAPSMHQLYAQQAMLLRCLFAIALLIAAVFFLRKVVLGKLYLLCMSALAVIVAMLPLLNLQTTWPFVFTSVLSSLIGFIVWCLLAFVSKASSLSPFLIFGVGLGFSHLGLAVGYLCGYLNVFQLLGIQEGNIGAPYVVVMIALVVGCAVLVFNEKDFDHLLEASGASKLNVRGAILQSREPKTLPKQDRPWQKACIAVGERALLSQRELELLLELACNRTPQEIASHLHIAVSTVRTHSHRIYVKLDVHSRDELIELVRMEYEKNNECS